MAIPRSRRRRLIASASLLAVVITALVGWWVYDRFTLNAAERNLVGTWAQTRDGDANLGGTLVEFVVRENRTVKLINRDFKTGAVTVAREEYDWWGISHGVVTIRRRSGVPRARPWFAWWDRPRRVESYDVVRLVNDGPDRIHYTVLRADQLGKPLDEPRPTGTWTRISEK